MRAITSPALTTVPTSATQAMRPSTSEASWESLRDITVPGSASRGAIWTIRAAVTPTEGGGGALGACSAWAWGARAPTSTTASNAAAPRPPATTET